MKSVTPAIPSIREPPAVICDSTEYWFLAEKLGQIAELVGFELKFREKWPQD